MFQKRLSALGYSKRILVIISVFDRKIKKKKQEPIWYGTGGAAEKSAFWVVLLLTFI